MRLACQTGSRRFRHTRSAGGAIQSARMRRRVAHIAVVLLVWAWVCLPWLGRGGLTMSEGHRVVPAWTMLETGRWLVPEMFGQAYLRKPPGAMWAFAGASALLGQTELAPRLVSAVAFGLLGLGSWWFARRWFGDRAGLCAGLATVLTPMLWGPARAAELESLNNLFSALAAWTIVELAFRRACKPTLATLALGAFVGAGALVKGPAGLPAALGMLVGCAWAARSWKALGAWRVWAGVAIGLCVFAGVWLAIEAQVRARGLDPVRQSPGAFMFERERLLDLLAFAPMVFLGGLPLSLGALFPWGPDARAEGDEHGREAQRRLTLARALTLGALAGVLLLLVSGVSNPRYAQPVVATLGPLAGWAVSNAGAGGVFRPHRARIARWMMLGGWPVIACVLLAGAGVFFSTLEARERGTSGRTAGTDAARALRDTLAGDGPVTVLSNGVVEARPETAWAFESEARRTGLDVRVRWIPRLSTSPQESVGKDETPARWWLLRDDERFDETGAAPGAEVLYSAGVYKFHVAWMRRSAHSVKDR